MLMAERHEKIVEFVNNEGSVRVSELSSLFFVTEETIRRDLEKLERDGMIKRSHGGAISVKQSATDIPYFEREVTNVEEKKEVAQKAIQYIEAGDRIILDASSTAWYMAKILPDIPITVVTNSVKVVMELSQKEKIKVISTGGMLAQRSLSFLGPQTLRALEHYYVDKAFISCQGVHPTWGISDSNEQQALVKSKFIDISSETYLLVDHSKFDMKSFAYITSIDKIDIIISDSNTKEESLAIYR